MEKSEGYRIKELHVSNIKRIKMVDITPTKDLVILEGDNANGKTSVMDSIAYLLGGQRLIPEEPIRKGEREGVITAIIGDFEISRRWTNPYTSYLRIKTKDGVQPKSPQAFLNERVGSFSLEVAELMNMTKDERTEVFKTITGLKLEDLRVKQEGAMDARKDEKKNLDRLQSEIKNYEGLPEIKKDLNFDSLQEERKQKEEANRKYQEKEESIENLENYKSDLESEDIEIDDEIEAYKKKIEGLKIAQQKKKGELVKTGKQITTEKTELISMERHDLSEIDTRIKQAMAQQEIKFKKERRDEIEGEIDKANKKIARHNSDLEKIKAERTRRIKEAAVPVEGVEFDGETIRYKGIEFEECSTAERIEMSIAIGIKENPRIRILLIRDGSAIGKAAMERIEQLARENDFQIWIEKVSEVKGNEIYIEDGMIK